MVDLEFYKRVYSTKITRDSKKVMLVKRYFCRRGLYMSHYPWVKLYKAIYDFKLIFRFKYNLATRTLSADYVPRPYRWSNQMLFFQFYLKLIRQYNWTQFSLKHLFAYVNKAKRACYTGLIKQRKGK